MKKLFLVIGAIAIIVATLLIQRPSSPQQSVVATSSSVATIRVADVSYSVEVTAGDSVIDAMRSLESHGLTFTSRSFVGMGEFVESINGRRNASNTYWILYINGATSTRGASSALLNSGDIIEWKYENGY